MKATPEALRDLKGGGVIGESHKECDSPKICELMTLYRKAVGRDLKAQSGDGETGQELKSYVQTSGRRALGL